MQTTEQVHSTDQHLLLLSGVVHVCKSTLAAILPVKVGGHENIGTTLFTGSLMTQMVYLIALEFKCIMKNYSVRN